MSTRSSEVYGAIGLYHWHGWTDVNEEDREWFRLELGTYGEPELKVMLNEDAATEAKVRELFVKMPTRVFDRIAHEYVARKIAESELEARSLAEWDAYEAIYESCAWCSRPYPDAADDPEYTARVRPHCKRCGGTGKPRQAPPTTPED